ncbi:hypothetical protein BC940DRAFT_319946 [Gongronella butleri]|nr:hypothetical protein BC940DRAFT_319946 [Gongronella butleri]
MATPAPCKIFELPSELLFSILDNVGNNSLCSLRLTTRKWDILVCPLLFKSLVLCESRYTMDPLETRVASLTNDAQPALSIGNYVHEIQVETRAIAMPDLMLIAQQCPFATRLIIPYKALRDMNRILRDVDDASRKQRRRGTEPTDPMMQHVFEKLFVNTPINELSVPGIINGELFHGGLLYRLGALRHLDLGSNMCPPSIPAGFKLDLLHWLQQMCPVLESLRCVLSQVGMELEIGAEWPHPWLNPVNRYEWLSLQRLDITVGATSFGVLHSYMESTVMLAFLSLVTPNLTDLQLQWIVCESHWLNPSQTMTSLKSFLGLPNMWQNGFQNLKRATLFNCQLDSYSQALLYNRSLDHLTLQSCVWGEHPTGLHVIEQLAPLRLLTELTLGTVKVDEETMATLRDYDRAPDPLCIDLLLDALPQLQRLKIQCCWQVCLSLERRSATSCLKSHLLTELTLEVVSVADTSVLEYISMRCVALSHLTLNQVRIEQLLTPAGIFRTSSLPDMPSNPKSLVRKLLGLQRWSNIVWLPLMHSKLKTLHLSSLILGTRGQPTRYIAFCESPIYLRDPPGDNYTLKYHEIYSDGAYNSLTRLPEEEFSEATDREYHRLVVLTKSINSPISYNHTQADI